jgi:hypothetical protein
MEVYDLITRRYREAFLVHMGENVAAGTRRHYARKARSTFRY